MVEEITQRTLNWIRTFIIEYNLCPFAKGPVNKSTLRIFVSETQKKNQALEDLMTEIHLLDDNPAIETTLVIFANSFRDFFTYLDFADMAEQLVHEQGYEGVYQLATFHPDYYFADASLDDVSNYTNRSPYPMLHILREDDVERAINAYGDTSKIPEKNKMTLQNLGLEKIKSLVQQTKN